MKGHPGIYLSAALVAASISACAPIKEDHPALAMYMELRLGDFDRHKAFVRVVDIQKAGESDTRFVPSASATSLWLREGDYEATAECLRPQTDKYNADILKRASPPDSDGRIRFTMKFQPEIGDRISTEYHFYGLDCATTADGKPLFLVMPLLELSVS
jgi:hypothetical protein